MQETTATEIRSWTSRAARGSALAGAATQLWLVRVWTTRHRAALGTRFAPPARSRWLPVRLRLVEGLRRRRGRVGRLQTCGSRRVSPVQALGLPVVRGAVLGRDVAQRGHTALRCPGAVKGSNGRDLRVGRFRHVGLLGSYGEHVASAGMTFRPSPPGGQMMVGAISSSINGRTRARLGQGLGRRPCLPKRCLRKTGEES